MVKDAVLIIGNGFDLDLGLPTRYSNFAESDFWPITDSISASSGEDFNLRTLNNTMFEASKESSWFDIEYILGQYATFNGTYNNPRNSYGSEVESQAIEDEKCYNDIVLGLKQYLLSIEKTEINENSVAAIVLKAIINSGCFSNIFSFNYTNLHNIAKRLGINKEFHYQHMHGSLDSDIILGIESRMDFYPGYRYLCKEYHPNYETRFLKAALEKATDIVIFGHSLSAIDYHYFQSFFSKQSSDNLGVKDKKYISVFTFDLKSQWDICDQLRNMNNKQLDNLFGCNVLHFVRTSEGSSEKLSQFLRYIEKLSHQTPLIGPSVDIGKIVRT